MITQTLARAMPSVQEVLPTFQALVPAERVEAVAKSSGQHFYARIYTPLIVVWGFLFQRLNPDHSLDAVVSQIADGAVDHLADPHGVSVSARVRSESTAAYSKARKRLPVAVLVEVAQHLPRVAEHCLGEGARWHGHRVALLDGTTLLARPTGDLVKRYGQAQNGHGTGYWVVIRAVAAFCLHTAALLAVKDGSQHDSEQGLAKSVLAQLAPDTVCLGDGNFGVFSIAQAARHSRIWTLLRVSAPRAKAVAKGLLHPGEDRLVFWTPSRADQTDKTMSVAPIVGRLIRVHLERNGFRPFDLYLFTTLLDSRAYPVGELVALYDQRWHVELDLRDVKSTLDMDLLTAKSEQMVQKELWAGLAAYNLVRVWMAQAASRAQRSPLGLSFAQCWRRVKLMLTNRRRTDTGQDTAEREQRLLERLAQCRLPKRDTFRVEPRAVRRRASPYPALRGSRHQARQAALDKRRTIPTTKKAEC